jgi:hypothetical protein
VGEYRPKTEEIGKIMIGGQKRLNESGLFKTSQSRRGSKIGSVEVSNYNSSMNNFKLRFSSKIGEILSS